MVIRLGLVIFDRDGVLNELVDYDHESGVAPRRVADVQINPQASELVAFLKERGIPTAIASNQPDVARGKVSAELSSRINESIVRCLSIDTAFVCQHDDVDMCNCRKPKPGLIIQALNSFNVSPSEVIFVGDRISDLKAGQTAGVFSVLISKSCKHKSHSNFMCVRNLSDFLSWLEVNIEHKDL